MTSAAVATADRAGGGRGGGGGGGGAEGPEGRGGEGGAVGRLLALPVQQLRAQLADDSRYFSQLLRRIPQHHYQARKEDDDAAAIYHARASKASKFMVNSRNKLSSQNKLKNNTKKAQKLKQAITSVKDAQREAAGKNKTGEPPQINSAASAAAKSATAAPAERPASAAEAAVAGLAQDKSTTQSDEGSEAAAKAATVQELGERLGGADMGRSLAQGAASSLQERLRQAIEAKRAMRNSSTSKSDDKQSIPNKKKKLKDARQDKALAKPPMPAVDKRAREVEAPTTDDDEAVTFSKFNLNEKKLAKPKRTPQQLLQKVEQHQKRLKELQEADPTKAGEIATKQSWQKAMQRAEGQKILDNPQLLKKKIKRIERSKRKSEREWKERNEEVTRSIKEQQDRRNKNLADRAKKKLERRREKVMKRRPGFVKGGV